MNLSQFVRNNSTFRESTLSRIDLDEVQLHGALNLIRFSVLPVVCSGVGKSGFIAAKMVATLNSLVKAVYLNPTDALHGDLGVVEDKSVVVLISNSGTTAELIKLLPSLQARKCQIISLVSNNESPLAEGSKHVIAYGAIREVDEHGLAPTTSTVVQLALVDALAAAVSRSRHFAKTDFFPKPSSWGARKTVNESRNIDACWGPFYRVKSDSALTDVLSVISAKVRWQYLRHRQ